MTCRLTAPLLLLLLAAAAGRSDPPPATAPDTAQPDTTRPGAIPADAPLLVVGFTLTPAPVAAGERLVFVVDGDVYPYPSRESAPVARHVTGEGVVAARELTRDGVRWVETEGGLFAEAARLDRPAEPVAADLPAGEEGLTAGRILPAAYAPSDLAAVPESLKAAGFEWRDMTLRRGALDAYANLIAAAAADSVRLGILSAFRPAEYQRRLYAGAVARDPAQNHSAAPGRSEHQLGTAVDVAVPGVPVLSRRLEGTPAYDWLRRRASEFGVVIPFSRERCAGRGVAFEPWHLRWVGDRTGEPAGW